MKQNFQRSSLTLYCVSVQEQLKLLMQNYLKQTEDCRDVATTSMIEPLCSTPTASDQSDDSNLGLCFKISVTLSDVITVPVTHCMCIDTSLVL